MIRRLRVVFRSSNLACNETIDVNSSAAVSLYMTSSSSSDVISRYPSVQCSLYVAARRGQRLSFTVFTLGGPSDAKVGDDVAWEERVGDGGEAGESARRQCDTRRALYIVDGRRTASSSLCHLPRFQSRQRLIYTSTEWRVAIYWTWTGGQSSSGHWDESEPSLDDDVHPFTSYILKVEGRLRFCPTDSCSRLYIFVARS